LVYYINAFDESFNFFLRENDIQNLEVAHVVTLKIGKNMIATKKVFPSSFRLFNLQEISIHHANLHQQTYLMIIGHLALSLLDASPFGLVLFQS
jgi:hypothetical protein